MAFPKGLFTVNLVRSSAPKAATRPFSQEAVRVSGLEGPRYSFRAPRQPEMPKPPKIGNGR